MIPLDMFGFSIYNSDSVLLFRLSVVAHPDITESTRAQNTGTSLQGDNQKPDGTHKLWLVFALTHKKT